MKKEILIPIVENKNSLIEEGQSIYQQFKMENPTHVKFLLTQCLFDKMNLMQELLTVNNFNKIEFSSLTLEEETICSKLTLLVNNKIIKPQYYEYYDEKLPVFLPQQFKIICVNFTERKFYIEFSYMNCWIENVFKTENFNI